MEDNKLSQYSQWGGLPATLAALDDFDKARSEDSEIAAMFAKLDRLESAPRTAAGLVEAMTACEFSPVEVSRINSPLLDGLWKAVTGREPDGKTPYAVNPVTVFDCLIVRLMFPRVYESTVRWIVSEANPESSKYPDRAFRCAFEIACCNGHHSVVKLLLPRLTGFSHDTSLFIGDLCERVCALGRLDILQTLMNARILLNLPPLLLTYPIDISSACQFGHADIAAWLLDMDSGPAALAEHGTASTCLTSATVAGHLSVVDLLLKRFLKLFDLKQLHAAWCESWRTSNVALSRLLADAVLTAGGTLNYTLCLERLVYADAGEIIPKLLAKVPTGTVVQFPPASVEEACRTGSLSALVYLKEAGLTRPEHFSQVDFAWVVRWSSLRLAKLVLDFGGSAIAVTDVVLSTAAVTGDGELIEALLNLLSRSDEAKASDLRQCWRDSGAVELYRRLNPPGFDFSMLDAARNGHVAMIEFATELGLQAAPAHLLEEALHNAIRSKKLPAVQCLWPTIPAYVAYSMLTEAVLSDDIAMVRYVREQCDRIPADKLPTFSSACSAVLFATVRGKLEACEVLLPLLLKFDNFSAEVLAALERALTVSRSDEGVWFLTSLLEESICHHSLATSFRLDILLTHAVEAGCLPMVRLLLNAGANPRERDTINALKTAHARGQHAMVDLLVDRGVPPFVVASPAPG